MTLNASNVKNMYGTTPMFHHVSKWFIMFYHLSWGKTWFPVPSGNSTTYQLVQDFATLYGKSPSFI